jgi:ATP-dependent DNA ligase
VLPGSAIVVQSRQPILPKTELKNINFAGGCAFACSARGTWNLRFAEASVSCSRRPSREQSPSRAGGSGTVPIGRGRSLWSLLWRSSTTDFSVLQNELKGKSTKIVMIAFDLLYLNGGDLRKLPLVERKAHLKKLIAGTAIQFSESFEVDGTEMYQHACTVGLEGVVSKVRDSRYSSGRGNDWVKKTCAQRETLFIAGYALDGNDWDGIYVGRRKGKNLVYAGKVDHGFDKTTAADLRKKLTPLVRKTQPYAKRVPHKAVWVEPKLLAEIEYRAKSA